MTLRIDMHVHSSFSKQDGMMHPRKLLELAKKKGLDGIAVTDHNTVEGGLLTKKLNKDDDFVVIPGAEIETTHGEIIGYNLTKNIRSKKPLEVIYDIKAQGGIVCVPHPFEKLRGGTIDERTLYKIIKNVDLIEGLNGRAWWLWNKRAVEFAKKYKKPIIAGSDAHLRYELGRCTTLYSDNLNLKKPLGVRCKRFPLSWFLYAGRTKIYKKFSF